MCEIRIKVDSTERMEYFVFLVKAAQMGAKSYANIKML